MPVEKVGRVNRPYCLNPQPSGCILLIGVSGELTAAGSIDFYFDVWAYDPSRYMGTIIDVSSLASLDPVGLSACRRTLEKVSRSSRRAALVIHPNGTMDSIVAAANVRKLVPVFTDRQEAVEYVQMKIEQSVGITDSVVGSL
jgi:hypothetical protein